MGDALYTVTGQVSEDGNLVAALVILGLAVLVSVLTGFVAFGAIGVIGVLVLMSDSGWLLGLAEPLFQSPVELHDDAVRVRSRRHEWRAALPGLRVEVLPAHSGGSVLRLTPPEGDTIRRRARGWWRRRETELEQLEIAVETRKAYAFAFAVAGLTDQPDPEGVQVDETIDWKGARYRLQLPGGRLDHLVVKVTGDGLTIRRLLKRRSLKWSDIEEVRREPSGGLSIVTGSAVHELDPLPRSMGEGIAELSAQHLRSRDERADRAEDAARRAQLDRLGRAVERE